MERDDAVRRLGSLLADWRGAARAYQRALALQAARGLPEAGLPPGDVAAVLTGSEAELAEAYKAMVQAERALRDAAERLA